MLAKQPHIIEIDFAIDDENVTAGGCIACINYIVINSNIKMIKLIFISWHALIKQPLKHIIA
jgi:hypothetical protein